MINSKTKRSVLLFALISCLLFSLLPATVFAGGEGLYVRFSYDEYDDEGNRRRDMYDLVTSGVIKSEWSEGMASGKAYDKYTFTASFVLEAPDGSHISVVADGGVSNINGSRNAQLSAQVTPMQKGKYTLISYTIPDGYELINETPISFTVTESDMETGLANGNCFLRLRKIPLTALPTSSAVLVNGKSVAFDAYNIGGSNYFKLRDLAFTLSGSEKQFEVGWDGENNAISLTSGKPYTALGGEMTGKGADQKTPVPTNSRIFLDGKEVVLTAYNIDGNNYFKLRDIGEAFDFEVDWDGEKNTIIIDTGKGYTPD